MTPITVVDRDPLMTQLSLCVELKETSHTVIFVSYSKSTRKCCEYKRAKRAENRTIWTKGDTVDYAEFDIFW